MTFKEMFSSLLEEVFNHFLSFCVGREGSYRVVRPSSLCSGIFSSQPFLLSPPSLQLLLPPRCFSLELDFFFYPYQWFIRFCAPFYYQKIFTFLFYVGAFWISHLSLPPSILLRSNWGALCIANRSISTNSKKKMQATQENIDAMSHYLQQTLSPDKTQRRQAEAFLTSVEVR